MATIARLVKIIIYCIIAFVLINACIISISMIHDHYQLQDTPQLLALIPWIQNTTNADTQTEKKSLIHKPSSKASITADNRMNRSNILRDISLRSPFPIDIVYTFAGERTQNGQRLRYNGELRYSIKSIYKYAPWAHTIFVVISDSTAIPSWIDPTKLDPKYSPIPLKIVKHSDIYSNLAHAKGNKNSDSIESRLHHIPGLANHFIYFNDDFFLFQNTSYRFFFTEDGIIRFPKGKYWNYYTHAKNSIAMIYPQNNYDKIIKTYPHLKGLKIPHRTKKHFYEHMPRAYTRSAWFELETYYFEWFQFVESHKLRFCSKYPDQKFSGCLEEIIYILMFTYRLLHYNAAHNDTYRTQLQKKDKDLYRLISRPEFELDVYQHPYNTTKWLHLWLIGKKDFNVGHLRRFTTSIKVYHPHTACINDVLSLNIKSTLYTAEMRHLLRFYRQWFKDDALLPFEKGDNFIEPSLRKYTVNLTDIKYNDFGYEIERMDKILFIHIPKNAGTSIEKFGVDHGAEWGQIQAVNKEFVCRKDVFNKSATRPICCHGHHLPSTYHQNAWKMAQLDTFCVIRHPYERLISQYRYRLLKAGYKKEEKSLMKSSYNLTENDVKYDMFWCKIDTFNDWIIASLKAYLAFTSIRDCHFVPQIYYILDERGHKKLCNNVIRMDNETFYEQFDDLMIKYKVNVGNDSLKDYHENWSAAASKKKLSKQLKDCKFLWGLDIDDIYPDTKQFIQQVYKTDFEYFDFDK